LADRPIAVKPLFYACHLKTAQSVVIMSYYLPLPFPYLFTFFRKLKI
jgi:hypothetical protein